MARGEQGVPRLVVAVSCAVFLVLGAVLGLAVAHRSGTDTTAATESADANDLLVMSAGSARVSNDGPRSDATLQLSGVDTQTIWFTDRPQRLAGSMLTSTLVRNWPDYFASSQPNAALTHRSPQTSGVGAAAVPVVLSNPAETARGVRFTVAPLGDAELPPDGVQLSGVRLFIDPPAARLTDFQQDPMVTPQIPPIPHVGGPVTEPSSPSVPIGELPAAKIGDELVTVGPPDPMVKGSSTVEVDGMPAARMGDPSAPSGTVELGNFHVMIGG